MIILDTHVWLWWVQQESECLKPAWLERIATADSVGVSAISCFEVAWLVQHGRIELPLATDVWFDRALSGSGIDLCPVSPKIAIAAVQLPEHHRDPQDRLIIATALAHHAELISADQKFPLYRELDNRLIA